MSETGTVKRRRLYQGQPSLDPTGAGGDPRMTGQVTPERAHGPHAGHRGHDMHAGHDPEQFRRRFWLSLVLTVPIVATSPVLTSWFGYTLGCPGTPWVGPVLGSVVFFYG